MKKDFIILAVFVVVYLSAAAVFGIGGALWTLIAMAFLALIF